MLDHAYFHNLLTGYMQGRCPAGQVLDYLEEQDASPKDIAGFVLATERSGPMLVCLGSIEKAYYRRTGITADPKLTAGPRNMLL